MTCLGCKHHLFHDGLGLFGMLFEVGAQCVAHGGLHGAYHLAVAEFGLGLAFELRFHNLDRDDCGQPFAEVVAGDFHLALFEKAVIFGIFFQCGCEAASEAGQVRSPFYRVDVVDKRIDVFVERAVICQGHLDGDSLALGAEMDNVVYQRFFVAVDILHELAEAVG